MQKQINSITHHTQATGLNTSLGRKGDGMMD